MTNMANICDNTFYAYSNCKDNLNFIQQFIKDVLHGDVLIDYGNVVEAYFDSLWTFPESNMQDMCNNLPNKDDEDLYMRCLSVEYGNLYHDLLVYDKETNSFTSV